MRIRLVTLQVALLAQVAVIVLPPPAAHAETGADAWLRYAPASSATRASYGMPRTVVALGGARLVQTARDELVKGVAGMLGTKLLVGSVVGPAEAIVLGPADQVQRVFSGVPVPRLQPDGFWLHAAMVDGRRIVFVVGGSDRGVLYGTFAFLRRIALREPIAVDERQDPAAPLRWVNEWNNLDGSIERGYAGLSIFFENNNVRSDLSRVGEYARLLASLGINGCDVSNVNANTRIITPEFVPQLVRLADAFRPWGVRLAVSIDFSSPQKIGGLDTFDPLDARVAAFWKTTVDRIYAQIPDFGGFVLKADSEGRLGPSAYNRTHADAANVIARPLAAHGGVLFYRGFVYDHRMDWRNLKNDRARAAVDNFKALDGRFDDNVILQIKHGPIDFQVREPASPLFGTLQRTNQAIELQITQEYLGQQRHIVYLPPMWKEVLDFDMQVKGGGTPVKDLVNGKTFGRRLGGFVGVSNVGRDRNWLGHHLAMSNLYGFGRLAWNPEVSSDRIAEEWTRLTFGEDPAVIKTVTGILRDSWPAYENYSGSLGIGTLTDILGVHFGPGVESSERNGWGQWHRADEKGVGMDRTVATGTGFISQVLTGGRTGVRNAGEQSGRAAPLFASRAIHTQASIWKDGDSAHLRSALSGRRPGGWVRRPLEDARRVGRPRALRRSARSARVPGRARDCLAGRGQQLVPAHILHSRCQGTRGSGARSSGGRVDAAVWIPGGRCHSVGNRLRWQGGGVQRDGRMLGDLQVSRSRRQERCRRAVFRPERRRLAVPVAGWRT